MKVATHSSCALLEEMFQETDDFSGDRQSDASGE